MLFSQIEFYYPITAPAANPQIMPGTQDHLEFVILYVKAVARRNTRNITTTPSAVLGNGRFSGNCAGNPDASITFSPPRLDYSFLFVL